jgi:hypothetical protein
MTMPGVALDAWRLKLGPFTLHYQNRVRYHITSLLTHLHQHHEYCLSLSGRYYVARSGTSSFPTRPDGQQLDHDSPQYCIHPSVSVLQPSTCWLYPTRLREPSPKLSQFVCARAQSVHSIGSFKRRTRMGMRMRMRRTCDGGAASFKGY